MIIIKSFLYKNIVYSRAVGNENGGHSLGSSVGKYLSAWADVLDRCSGVSIKVKHNFEISQGSSLHTQHRCIERE